MENKISEARVARENFFIISFIKQQSVYEGQSSITYIANTMENKIRSQKTNRPD